MNKVFTNAQEKKSEVANVKTNAKKQLNITQSQLDRIDTVIRQQYDCNFASLMHHRKLQVLYGDQLDDMFSKCQDNQGTRSVTTRNELAQQIRTIAGIEDEEDDDDYYEEEELT